MHCTNLSFWKKKKVKNLWFWLGFKPAIYRLEGHCCSGLIFTLYHSCWSGSQILVIDCRGIKLLCFANINWTYEHHQKKHIEHGEAMPLCFDDFFLFFHESKAKVQGMMLKFPWLTLLWSTIASKDFQMLVNCERSGKKYRENSK